MHNIYCYHLLSLFLKKMIPTLTYRLTHSLANLRRYESLKKNLALFT